MDGDEPPITPYSGSFRHLLRQQQEQQELQMFWSYHRQEIDQTRHFKIHHLPLARIKKIMKADEDVWMISAEAPVLLAKACELFVLELTIRSWLYAAENRRKILHKSDIVEVITRTQIFDFLVDILPRDEIKDEGSVGELFDEVPYYYPDMEQPAGAPGSMMIRTPSMDTTGMYLQPPSQAWQSAWQASAEDGRNDGQPNLDG